MRRLAFELYERCKYMDAAKADKSDLVILQARVDALWEDQDDDDYYGESGDGDEPDQPNDYTTDVDTDQWCGDEEEEDDVVSTISHAYPR